MQNQAAGYVRDRHGAPIAGAVVSDCLFTHATGPDGRFHLPGWGPFVWICPPPSWSCDHWWQRRHEGSHDFVLSPARTSGARIAHITDLHLTHRRGPNMGSLLGQSVLHPLAGAIRNGGASLIVVTGDLTDRGTVAELKAAVKELAGTGVPFRLVPGNHDHYGHQDEPRATDVPFRDNRLGTGTFDRWEEVVGPRW